MSGFPDHTVRSRSPIIQMGLLGQALSVQKRGFQNKHRTRKSSAQIIEWSLWPNVNQKVETPHAVRYSSLLKRDLAPHERAQNCSRD